MVRGDAPVHVAGLQVEHVLGGGGGVQHVATCNAYCTAQQFAAPERHQKVWCDRIAALLVASEFMMGDTSNVHDVTCACLEL